MTTLRTYDPFTHKRSKLATYVSIILLLIFVAAIAYFVPGIKGKIIVFVFVLAFAVLLFSLGKFYNWKYNGGAEVNVTKELVEIKLPNRQRKVFPINSIKKIMIYDNSSKFVLEGGDAAPLLFTFIIWTSSSPGKVRLRFTNKKFIQEILKHKKPNRKGRNIFSKLIHDNLEVYCFSFAFSAIIFISSAPLLSNHRKVNYLHTSL